MHIQNVHTIPEAAQDTQPATRVLQYGLHLYIKSHMHPFICVCMYIFTYTYVYTCINKYICICVYLYVYK